MVLLLRYNECYNLKTTPTLNDPKLFLNYTSESLATLFNPVKD